ncbi:LAGLIDADG family homing endonuclease [Robertmurraya sp. FSL R5-0851]|uniref:LAGLIDADG family homing endonuclease n=1 Tax=Robertmurraya sp. FSL R5-0851 TaxID=2921584 RepID=UPI0030F94745
MKEWEASYIAGIIDGEGSISLTRMHKGEFRRPCISISSTDKELLIYIKSLTDGVINNKKNYNPKRHKDSYTLTIKKKEKVFEVLEKTHPYLRVNKKRARAIWILKFYDKVSRRNGKYSPTLLKQKLQFEEEFFLL